MNEAFHFIFSLIGTGTVAVFVITWWAASTHPEVIARNSTAKTSFWQLVWMISLMAGAVTTFYLTFQSILSWIPASFGSTDENGDWQPLRQSIGGMVGLTVGLFAAKWVLDFASKGMEADSLRAECVKLRQAINAQAILLQQATVVPEVRKVVPMLYPPDQASVASIEKVTREDRGLSTIVTQPTPIKNTTKTLASAPKKSIQDLMKQYQVADEGVSADAWNGRRKLQLRPLPQSLNVPNVLQCEIVLSQSSYRNILTRSRQLCGKLLNDLRGEPPRDSNRNIQLQELGVEGLKNNEFGQLSLEYRGDPHGGRTTLDWTVDGKHNDLKQELIVERTPQGIASAFFIMWEFPTIGAFWHGLYDLPTIFYLDDAELLLKTLRDKEGRKPEDPVLDSVLSIPTGLRLATVEGRLRVSNLAYVENIGVIDCWIDINNEGKITDVGQTLILKTQVKMFY